MWVSQTSIAVMGLPHSRSGVGCLVRLLMSRFTSIIGVNYSMGMALSWIDSQPDAVLSECVAQPATTEGRENQDAADSIGSAVSLAGY